MNQIHYFFNVPKKSNLLVIVAGGSISDHYYKKKNTFLNWDGYQYKPMVHNKFAFLIKKINNLFLKIFIQTIFIAMQFTEPKTLRNTRGCWTKKENK
jgi:hypothetical protein